VPQAVRLPPMAAGVFGYLGYDMVRQMERLAPAKEDRIGAPDALFVRPTVMIVLRFATDLHCSRRPAGVAAKAAMKRRSPPRQGRRDAGRAGASHAGRPQLLAQDRFPTCNPFSQMVERAKNTFAPATFSGRAVAAVPRAFRFAAALYRALRRVNQRPFYLSRFRRFQIVCSGPESSCASPRPGDDSPIAGRAGAAK
jgi:anthranilate synthase component 1